ncbi:MAG: PAS/PAC sensor hybrid histidine kinase [uncultured bacterium]|nr:MAG: PAS/PAC sensor hybrid histidine kinase [uncultured bacterium]
MIKTTLNESARPMEAEDSLRKSEHDFRILFENHPLGVIRMDHEGTILDCNDRFLELVGASREQLIGGNGAEHGLPGIRLVIKKALAGEVAIVEGEYSTLTGSKTTLLRIVYKPVKPGGEPPTDIIATVEDISSGRHAEEEFRTVSERMKAIFSSIKDPILVHPYSPHFGHGTFSEVNEVACTRYGYSREEFLRLSVQDIIKQNPEQKLLAVERLEKIMASGHMVFETVHVTRNGEEFPVEVSVSTMEQGEEKAVLAVVRDISERHAAQREKAKLEGRLQQAQKMESVGRLAGGVAHDFNNMLSVILGYCDLALIDVTPEHQLYRNLIEIRKAARHSADLTHQLLAFARQQTIAPRVLDLNEAVGSMLAMLRRLIGEEIILVWHPAGNIWPIKVDPAQINQILANLSINARDAISGNGTITIGTENVVLNETDCVNMPDSHPGDYVVLSIRDNGHGIEKETLEHIFEPFFTTKGQGEGTGLGLATVYGIIQQNRGFIRVTSEPGRGTTFRNYLPRFQGQEEILTGTQRNTEANDATGRETILLVEDERAILEVISTMLRRQGYNILAAATPHEALRIAGRRDREIHLLLTDVIMPEMNGKELARRLQKIHPGLRCLYMSGYTADVIADHGVLEAGILFIRKPFSQDDLLATLRGIFDRN